MALNLSDIQPFIDYVDANLGIKTYTTDSLSSWSTSGRPLVSTGVGYGVTLGNFTSSVTSVNGHVGVVTLTKNDIGLGNVPNIDTTNASNIITGTLPLSVIPSSALERLVHVADETARFALTTTQAQNGDTVQQDDTGVMYIVVDETKLNQAAGYNEYRAGIAASVDWSGIQNIPSAISDIVLTPSIEKDMLVYQSGHWAANSPLNVRANLDLPIKGDWDMTPSNIETPILQYPQMDVIAENLGAVPFPITSPNDAYHSFNVGVGTIPTGTAYLASTTNMANLLSNSGNTADLPFPINNNITALLLEFDVTNITSLPTNSGQLSLFAAVAGKNTIANEAFQTLIQIGINNTSANYSVSIDHHITNTTTNVFQTLQSLTLGSTLRIVMYFDGATRKVGLIINGVDQGWVGSPAFTMPTSITSLGIFLQAIFAGIDNTDPLVGQLVSIHHSIDTSLITETLPGTLVPWYSAIISDPTPPVGVEVGNRFIANPGGSYMGVQAATGEVVEFIGPTSIYAYPKSQLVVHYTDYTNDINTINNSISNANNNITNLQSTVNDHETRLTVVEGEIVPFDVFQKIQHKAKGKSQSGFFVARIANEPQLPYTDLDTYIISTAPTGVFSGSTPGYLAIYNAGTNQFEIFMPPEGTKALCTLPLLDGYCLAYHPTSVYYGQKRYSGNEPTATPYVIMAPNWVLVPIDSDNQCSAPVFLNSNSVSGFHISAAHDKELYAIIGPNYNQTTMTITTSVDNQTYNTGSILLSNESGNTVTIFGDCGLTGLDSYNAMTGAYGHSGTSPVVILKMRHSSKIKINWHTFKFYDSIISNIRNGIYYTVEEIITSPIVGDTVFYPIIPSTQFIDISSFVTTTTSSVAFDLPNPIEGRRLLLRTSRNVTVDLTGSNNVGIVDTNSTTFILYSDVVTEMVVKNFKWVVITNRVPYTNVKYKTTTTSSGTKVLTADGTTNIFENNVPKTCMAPDIGGVSVATHTVTIQAVGNSFGSDYGYYRQMIIRCKCTNPSGTLTYSVVGITNVYEDFDNLSHPQVDVLVDGSNVDGLLRISADAAAPTVLNWTIDVTSIYTQVQ